MAILGASGHGKVLADIAEASGWDHVAFFDDAWPKVKFNGCWSVDGDGDSLAESLGKYSGIIVGIGSNLIRAEKTKWLTSLGAPMVNLVHPSAVISRYATLGFGTVVMPGVIVNCSSVIGNGVILNTGCSIDHDCNIGDYVHISPGARLAGGVAVGSASWIGIGASVKQSICIGTEVMVGAGAAVVTDLPDTIIAAGIPARQI